MRTIITNATVEITLPDALDLYEFRSEHATNKVKIGLGVKLHDVVLRLPSMNGKIGDLQPIENNGDVITIKTLLLECMTGTMLAHQNEAEEIVLFDFHKAEV